MTAAAPPTPVAIVTGAGSGIGRSVCELLAAAQYRIALVGRTERSLEETMSRISAQSAAAPEMLIVGADVSDAQQARGVVDIVTAQWGRIDALVNNAGVAPLEPIDRTDEDLLYQTFAVNAFGPAHLIAAAWPVFKSQKNGCIVNVSTVGVADPFPGFFVYAASKAALESMTRSVMNEGKAHGIRAFSVAPGAVETGMLRRAFSERELPPEKTLDPRDVAHVICDCILGRREGDEGTSISVQSP